MALFKTLFNALMLCKKTILHLNAFFLLFKIKHVECPSKSVSWLKGWIQVVCGCLKLGPEFLI